MLMMIKMHMIADLIILCLGLKVAQIIKNKITERKEQKNDSDAEN